MLSILLLCQADIHIHVHVYMYTSVVHVSLLDTCIAVDGALFLTAVHVGQTQHTTGHIHCTLPLHVHTVIHVHVLHVSL